MVNLAESHVCGWVRQAEAGQSVGRCLWEVGAVVMGTMRRRVGACVSDEGEKAKGKKSCDVPVQPHSSPNPNPNPSFQANSNYGAGTRDETRWQVPLYSITQARAEHE